MEGLSQWVVVANTAGAIVVVVLFLRDRAVDRQLQREAEKDRQEVLKHIGDECHENSMKVATVMAKALEKSDAVIMKNTEVLGETNARLAEVNESIREANRQRTQ